MCIYIYIYIYIQLDDNNKIIKSNQPTEAVTNQHQQGPSTPMPSDPTYL
jgi:hypothetical protein